MVFFLLGAVTLAFCLMLIFTPISIRLIKRFNLIDDPGKRMHPASIHTKPIPRGGGLPIYLSILAAVLIFLPLNTTMISILLGGFLVVIVGLLDDKYDISPYIRFFSNIVVASIVVLGGINIPYITSPTGGILHFASYSIQLFQGFEISLSQILAIGWIVWVMNMLNWSKGVDGQMPGIAAISAIIIGVASLRFPVLDVMNIHASILAFIVAGSALGFLVFNFYPAKIFPGYSATILGFILGILSILSSVKLATALLVMGIPMADALFTITRRVLAKRSPFWHDKGHLHHLLLKQGMGQRSVALFYWGMSLILGLASLTLSSKGKLFVIIGVIAVVGGFILTLKHLGKKAKDEK